MAGYTTLYELLKEETKQLLDEGREIDREEFLRKIEECGGDREKLLALYNNMEALPMRKDYKYVEPTELEEIEKEAEGTEDGEASEIDATYFRGAWLGRCIGCAFGQPCEGWSSENIRKWYKAAGKYPIKYFFPTVSGGQTREHASTDERICGMPLDDDTRFTVLNTMMIREKNGSFDSYDVGNFWLHHLPLRFVFTAETQAYLNFATVDSFTPWYKPENALEIMKNEKVNTYMNPYREWIGAQIRADAFAYAYAGLPQAAARKAHADAYLTHIKNGIYGETFFAALISAAFTEKDVEKCFETALKVIPKKSRFYEEAVYVRKMAESAENREELIDALVERGEKYSHVHTINNAAFCIAAIFFGKGDFRESVSFAVECGMDTDCNGATVGSFMGALLGEEKIPKDLKDAMKDKFSVGVYPYDDYSIRKFADECKELRDRLNKRA
ncbi:MAG: ADP-ribosylglycohydrolase family protein [Clostridiales bacterium]|nr:ADP-ribosylglycohydrolase family protein [Candidatus Coliplasma equi]